LQGRQTKVDIFGGLYYVVDVTRIQVVKEAVPYSAVVITLMDHRSTHKREFACKILFSDGGG
jgi:hypothetical protein